MVDSEDEEESLSGDRLESVMGPSVSMNGPIYIRTARERDSWPFELQDLAKWVSWFAKTYRLSSEVIPPCWYRHDDLLGYLLGLWLYAETAYSPDQDPSHGAVWHDFMSRYVQAVRAATSTLSCVSQGHHVEPSVPAWLDAAAPEWQSEFEQWIEGQWPGSTQVTELPE